MSACGEFAEHVWKPGSCKNCFHPRSAHGQTGTAGSARIPTGPHGEDEDGQSNPSPYSKPTIAVRPTMMEIRTDVNMNSEQDQQKPCESLRKSLDLSSLYIDTSGCNKPFTVLTQNCVSAGNFSPTGLSKDFRIISNVCVSLEENGNADTFKPATNGVKNNYANGNPCLCVDVDEAVKSQAPVGIRTTPGLLNNVSSSAAQSPDSLHRSASDSESVTQNSTEPANGPKEAEPIYAESSKRKRHTHEDPISQQSPEPEVGENQRTTISIMAAHSEQNLTFYLSSPDSAVGTQWAHFSPAVPTDPSSPVFQWSSVTSPSTPAKTSPPVPPKIHTRSPRLGTSSLCFVPELGLHSALPPKLATSVSLQAAPRTLRLQSLSMRSLEVCIDEVEEESEAAEQTPCDPINGPAVPATEGTEKVRATPDANNSIAQTPADESPSTMLKPKPPIQLEEPSADATAGPDPAPPPPLPKKHPRTCRPLSNGVMDTERLSTRGSLENLSQSLSALSASTDSLCDADLTLRSCPPAHAPSPSPPDSAHQPPPLPQKKLVNRTVSAPVDSGVTPGVRQRPRPPFSGSETNISRPEHDPSISLFSSSECLAQAADQVKVQRVGGLSRGGVSSSSSPQLHTPSGPALASGSTLQLHALLTSGDSREGVYSRLGGLYAESLRRLALKCEEHFSRGQRNPLRFDESTWSLFKLTCNRPSCVSGDAVYYSASCASDPRNTYAVKICKGQGSEGAQADLYGLWVQQNLPQHFNLQQDCGHFIACVPRSMLPGASEEGGAGEQERVVVITREVPRQSAADFVREWETFHAAQPEVYERRVCFLLLQLCAGLEHLKGHGVTHRHLCLENLLLVPPRAEPDPQQRLLPRLLISNFSKAKRRQGEEERSTVTSDPRLRRDMARLAPEIVSAAQYEKFDEFQTGILIYELLHQPNPFESSPALRHQHYTPRDLPPLPAASIYSPGLQRLAQLLLEPEPGRRLHIGEARRALQGLLWGPRGELVAGQPRPDALLGWLDVKRALLMMKFAERSLEPRHSAELEDWLCCQYFSSANPTALCHSARLLYDL